MASRFYQNAEYEKLEEGKSICDFDYVFHLLRLFLRFKKHFFRRRKYARYRFQDGPPSWKFADENLVFDCKCLRRLRTASQG